MRRSLCTPMKKVWHSKNSTKTLIILLRSPFPMALALSAPKFVPNSARSIENKFYYSFSMFLHCQKTFNLTTATWKIYLFLFLSLFTFVLRYVCTVFLFSCIWHTHTRQSINLTFRYHSVVYTIHIMHNVHRAQVRCTLVANSIVKVVKMCLSKVAASKHNPNGIGASKTFTQRKKDTAHLFVSLK